MLKYELIDFPDLEILKSVEAPSVSALYPQVDGSILCGLLFAKPFLWRLTNTEKWERLKLRESVGENVLGVTHGLRSTLTKTTAFAVLHSGTVPGFFSSIMGADALKKSGVELLKFLRDQDGGVVGAHAQHSLCELEGDEISVRRHKEPGVLLDTSLIGEYLLGLTGSSVWKEPYMQTEKRETLRSDLSGNLQFIRDSEEILWFMGKNGRFVRMLQTDVKAAPTPLKSPDFSQLSESFLRTSVASSFDHWAYVCTYPSGQLFRIRRNPVSREEEIETIKKTWMGSVTALALENTESAQGNHSFLWMTTHTEEGVGVYRAELRASEDPEERGPQPEFEKILSVSEMKAVGVLGWDAQGILWGGENFMGSGLASTSKPRLLKILSKR